MRVRFVAAPERADLDAAADVVAERLVPTPLVPAPALGDGVHLKLETLQPTGSFKVRGGLAALSRLGGAGPAVTASAGNAGLGLAWAASALGVRATIVVPETASPAKVAALRALPVELIRHGAGYDEAEAHALSLGSGTYVSSYNDPGVIAGQATIERELDAQLPGPLTVAAPLGAGSLAAGLGVWASTRAGARVVGVEAERSTAMSAALAAGRITPVEIGDTIADGLAGNIEPGAVTFDLVREHVAAVVQASESEIEEAIRFLARAHGIVAEGGGATARSAGRSRRPLGRCGMSPRVRVSTATSTPQAIGRGRGPGLERGRNPPGWRADVRYVPSSENRSHGATLGDRLERFCNGTRFRYVFR